MALASRGIISIALLVLAVSVHAEINGDKNKFTISFSRFFVGSIMLRILLLITLVSSLSIFNNNLSVKSNWKDISASTSV